MESAATRHANKIDVKRHSKGPQSYAYAYLAHDRARHGDAAGACPHRERGDKAVRVTGEYVEQVCRANAFPIGYKYTAIMISDLKRTLAADIPPEYRLKSLDFLDRWANEPASGWLTADVIAAIDPMCDAAHEMFREAMQLDRGKPGRPGAFDALAKFFPAFAVLNPSLMTALEMEPRRLGNFLPVDTADM